MPAKGGILGFEYMQFYRTLNQKSYGSLDPLAAVNTDSSPAYLFKDVFSAGMPDVDRVIGQLVGSSFIGQMLQGTQPIPALDIVVPLLEGNANKLTVGGNVDTTTLTNATIISDNHSNPHPNQGGLIMAAPFMSRDSGSDGDTYYVNIFFPNGQMYPRGIAQLTREGGVNQSAQRYRFVPNYASKFPNGQAFSSTQGFYDNRSAYFYMITQFPVALHTFIGDGSLSAYTVSYLPAYSTVTSGKTDNWFTKDAVNTAPTSIATATGIVTLATTSVAASLYHALYQTRRFEPST